MCDDNDVKLNFEFTTTVSEAWKWLNKYQKATLAAYIGKDGTLLNTPSDYFLCTVLQVMLKEEDEQKKREILDMIQKWETQKPTYTQYLYSVGQVLSGIIVGSLGGYYYHSIVKE
jgi:hypothetical protein